MRFEYLTTFFWSGVSRAAGSPRGWALDLSRGHRAHEYVQHGGARCTAGGLPPQSRVIVSTRAHTASTVAITEKSCSGFSLMSTGNTEWPLACQTFVKVWLPANTSTKPRFRLASSGARGTATSGRGTATSGPGGATPPAARGALPPAASRGLSESLKASTGCGARPPAARGADFKAPSGCGARPPAEPGASARALLGGPAGAVTAGRGAVLTCVPGDPWHAPAHAAGNRSLRGVARDPWRGSRSLKGAAQDP